MTKYDLYCPYAEYRGCVTTIYHNVDKRDILLLIRESLKDITEEEIDQMIAGKEIFFNGGYYVLRYWVNPPIDNTQSYRLIEDGTVHHIVHESTNTVNDRCFVSVIVDNLCKKYYNLVVRRRLHLLVLLQNILQLSCNIRAQASKL